MPLIPSENKERSYVNAVFSPIASKYDFCNDLISLGMHTRWRKKLAGAIQLPPGSRILDCCTGTGAVLPELEKFGYQATGADFCLPMLQEARAKFRLSETPKQILAAESKRLPFPDGSFDAITVAFGIRSFPDRAEVFREFNRVLNKSGKLVILEAARPKNPVYFCLYYIYASILFPLAGALLARSKSAYQYLRNTSLGLQCSGILDQELAEAGFKVGSVETFALQSIWLVAASKD